MTNEDLINKLNKVAKNLETVKSELRKSNEILNDSITLNGNCFKEQEFTDIKKNIDEQLKSINSFTNQ